jgi:beta-alanine degradation protein BauB
MALKYHERMAGVSMTEQDPTITDPTLYAVVFENERVRVLEYRDQPGAKTNPHRHPDTVMVTLSSFQRRVSSGDRRVDIELPAGQVRWIAAQDHWGENIGATETHGFFIELKGPNPPSPSALDTPLGPSPA